MADTNNLGSTNQKIVLYNLKALQQIFKEELGGKLGKESLTSHDASCGGTKSKDEAERSKSQTEDKEKDMSEWRRLPSVMLPRECVIIASGGECQGPSVMPKKRDNTQTGSDLQLLRRELDVVQEKMRQDDRYRIVQVCADYPGVEMSRDYYLEKIKQLMTGCRQPGGGA